MIFGVAVTRLTPQALYPSLSNQTLPRDAVMTCTPSKIGAEVSQAEPIVPKPASYAYSQRRIGSALSAAAAVILGSPDGSSSVKERP